MEGTRLELENVGSVKFDVRGDIKIIGHDKHEFISLTNPERLTFEKKNGIVTIRAEKGCRLLLPKDVNVDIAHAGGDVNVIGLDRDIKGDDVAGDLKILQSGKVEIGKVSGDIRLVDIKDEVKIDRISGDLSSVNIKKSVTVGSIAGDASIVNSDGDLIINNCSGDCKLTDIKGTVHLDCVNGDMAAVKILGGLSAVRVDGDATCVNVEGDINLDAAGDILIDLKSDVSRKVNLSADGDVTIHLDRNPSVKFMTTSEKFGTELNLKDRKEIFESAQNTFEIGGHKVSCTIVAGKKIHLTEDPIRQIDGDIDIELGDLGLHIGDELSANIDEMYSRNMEKMSKKMEKISKKVEKINQKAEIRVNAALRKIGHTVRIHSPYSIDFGEEGSEATMPENEPVSELERTLILKMLQEKKITPEEAEKLFEALEGNYS